MRPSLSSFSFSFFPFFDQGKRCYTLSAAEKYIYTVQYKQGSHASQRVQHGGKRSSISWHDLNTKQSSAPGSRSFFIFILDSVYYTHSPLSLFCSFSTPILIIPPFIAHLSHVKIRLKQIYRYYEMSYSTLYGFKIE